MSPCHNVQEDHGIVPAVDFSHEVDKVAAHILYVNEKMCLLPKCFVFRIYFHALNTTEIDILIVQAP